MRLYWLPRERVSWRHAFLAGDTASQCLAFTTTVLPTTLGIVAGKAVQHVVVVVVPFNEQFLVQCLMAHSLSLLAGKQKNAGTDDPIG